MYVWNFIAMKWKNTEKRIMYAKCFNDYESVYYYCF